MHQENLQFRDYQQIELGPAFENRRIFKIRALTRCRSFCRSYCRQVILPHITGTSHIPLFKLAPYGTVDSLKRRSAFTRCRVCRLLVDLVARHLNNESTSSSPKSNHVWLRPYVDSGGYLFDVYLDGRELGAMRHVTKTSFDRLLKSPNFNNLKTDRPALSDLIKAWMNRCRESHGDTCNTSFGVSSQRYKSSCKLILIDTIEERLVLEQPSLERRYIALSYVWGGVSAFQTTTKNFQRL